MAVDLTSKDKREQILAYLHSLLGTVPGIVGAYRNRGELEGLKRPAAILLDGREDLVTEIRGQSLNAMPAAIFRILPQVFIICQARDNAQNLTVNGVAAPIGPELSAFRTAVVKALAGDVNLAAYLGSSGQVEFLGAITDMQTGSTLEGQMQLNFALTYVLDPRAL